MNPMPTTQGDPGGSAQHEQLGDLLALQAKVTAAARGMSVLCVLDDVWDPAHARVLGEPLDGALRHLRDLAENVDAEVVAVELPLVHPVGALAGDEPRAEDRQEE